MARELDCKAVQERLVEAMLDRRHADTADVDLAHRGFEDEHLEYTGAEVDAFRAAGWLDARGGLQDEEGERG